MFQTLTLMGNPALHSGNSSYPCTGYLYRESDTSDKHPTSPYRNGLSERVPLWN